MKIEMSRNCAWFFIYFKKSSRRLRPSFAFFRVCLYTQIITKEKCSTFFYTLTPFSHGPLTQSPLYWIRKSMTALRND